MPAHRSFVFVEQFGVRKKVSAASKADMLKLAAQFGVRKKVLVFSTTFYEEERAHVTTRFGLHEPKVLS